MAGKLCFAIMTALTFVRLVSGGYVIYLDDFHLERFPLAVYIGAGITVLLGILILAKCLLHRATYRDLQWFYGINGLCVLFNLICFKIMARAELTTPDLLFLGTALDVLLMGVIPLMFSSPRYTRKGVELP